MEVLKPMNQRDTLRGGIGAVVTMALLVLSGPTFAQEQREIGAEEERIRRPKKLEVPERVSIPIELPPEGELPPIAEGAPPITVVRVEVEGATLLPASEAERLTAPVVERTVTLRELREVAQAITRWYRGKGYVTSRALVPAQAVDRGVVHLRVIEGKVGEVRFEGNKHFRTELLARYVRAKKGEILWLPDLEQALGSLNAHPDRKAKLVLSPSAEPETTDLIFQVTDRKPFHANYGVDTLGQKTTGLIRQSVGVAHGNLTGRDDQIFVRMLLSEGAGLWGGGMNYLRPITSTGMLATLDVSGVKSQVRGDLKGLRADGNAVTVSPGLILPLMRRTHWELEGTLGFDFKRVRTFEDDLVTSKDDLRVLRGGVNLLQEDNHGRSLFVQETRLGIPDFLGGSDSEDPAASRAGAGGEFVRYTASILRQQNTPFLGSNLVLRLSGQVSSDRLVFGEQFRLGGFETVRGYPEGEYLADYGYQSTVELRTPLDRVTPAAGDSKNLYNRFRKSVLLVGFWDFAEGFLRDPRAGEDADARLSGLGFGFRLRPTEESIFQLDLGWPVGDRDAEKDRPRIHLIARFGF